MVLKYFIKKFLPKKKYRNIIESIYWNGFVRKTIGLTVIEVKSVAGVLEKNISIFGLIGYSFYAIAFTYCVCIAYSQDQSLLRTMYDTKLKQYGDLFEKVATVVFVTYAMNKLSLDLSGDMEYAQMNVVVDRFITKDLRGSVDYNMHAVASLYMALGQEILHFFRIICIYGILYGQVDYIPIEKIFQGAYSDGLTLGISSAYCYYLFVWKEKYEILNRILKDMRERKLWEQTLYLNIKGSDSLKAMQLQDKYLCEKIKKCASLYTQLYVGIKHINDKYGIAMALTIFVCTNYIILYMFYFMEATASGMFHDVERYLRLLVFIVWQIGYCVFVLVVIVSFTEDTLKEAKKTSLIINEIIHCDFGPEVNAEAVQFSIQLLHQVPILTTNGLFVIDYSLLYDGSRYILQFLVMLLQFVDTK